MRFLTFTWQHLIQLLALIVELLKLFVKPKNKKV